MAAGKRYAVLLCAEDSEYVKKMYGGYFGVFRKMLAEEGERWDVYRVACGEFPSDEEVEAYEGFVITGSCNDAHGNDVWIHRLLALLKRLDFMKKKVLGICFGHQILGRALGGKVGRNVSGWDIGVRTVNLSSSSKIFSSLKVPARLPLIECHRDEIRELPPKAEVIGSSDKTGIEMFRYGDHFMGIQGHPEYNKDILLHLIDRLLKCKDIKDSIAEEAKKNVEELEPNREAWKKLCVSFLKGRL
ncbi:putative glutamine amidotransferase [Tripterygium wilfordii]|uniref:Putative glutamine amidotransferase n=1 Tax=Tripterygium wilfordii TaxID=458696 RepID=A0A7J7CH57_TRIWF|nr:gamma-glutamyl peptidase 5-like [Tripterygium wilfordii]KAF5733375.1 putative glutamine amidotransferase [Tripterygium wilfordii]